MIKTRTKKFAKSQLDKIWVDSTRGHTTSIKRNKVVIDSTDKMHKKLLARNRKHLNQASVTPFTYGDLSTTLGIHGDTDECERILEGTWIPPVNTDPDVIRYVEALKCDDNTSLDSLPTQISMEEYCKFWSKKRESTATSPLGIHVGHYKVSIENVKIAEVHRAMMEMPFKYGFAPERWCSSVQLMLQKDPGQPWIHRLRIIELLDASFNGALMILIRRKMVYHAKKHNCIHQSNYGSVPGKTAQSAVLHKKLALDIITQQRESGAIFECDATGCYDRILPNLQTLHTRRVGLEKNASLTMSKTLHKMRRFVGTKFGQSKQFIRTNTQRVLYGIGQGSGGGPGVWLTHSTVLFNILDKEGVIPHFKSPDNKIECCTGGTGFVDDVSLIAQSRHNSIRIKPLMKNLKKNAQTWEKSLHISGGKLELVKCFWYLILWKWVSGNPVLTKTKDQPIKLRLKQSESRGKRETTIKRIDIDEAHKVLGVRISADGKWTAEYDEWLTKGRDFANVIRAAKFNRTCGIKIFQFIWTAKVRYPMSIIGFNRKQCEKIQSPVVAACLSAAGLSRTFPRAVVFAPLHLGGLGWLSMTTIQAQETITIALRHIKADDTVGKLLKISLQFLQFLAGTTTPVLEMEDQIPAYVRKSWVYSLHKTLVDNALKLRIHDSWTPFLCRNNDVAIMNVWIQKYTCKQLLQLNMCRLYLRVFTLSDMCTVTGTTIMEQVWEVRKPPRTSTYEWPHQPRPPRTAIKM